MIPPSLPLEKWVPTRRPPKLQGIVASFGWVTRMTPRSQNWRLGLQQRCVYCGPGAPGAQAGPSSDSHSRSEGLSSVPSASAVSPGLPMGSNASSAAPGRLVSSSRPVGPGVQEGVQGAPGVGRGGNQEKLGGGARATNWGRARPEEAACGMRKKM